jgi:hypothetical protein
VPALARIALAALAPLAPLAPLGCDDGGGEGGGGDGSLVIRVSGEGAAKNGYPYEKNGALIAFADGWSLRFSKYIASVGELRLASSDGSVAVEAPETYVADLHRGDPTVATYAGLAARRWDRFRFHVVAARPDAINLNGVDAADLARMVQGGYNYWVEGEATKGDRTVTFAWGLRNPTRNANCTSGVDGTDGFVIRNNATTGAELTIHIDHLFWTSLGTERAELRFDAIAAVAGDDDHVAFDELALQPLADLRAPGGGPLVDEAGAAVAYDPGSVPLAAPTLQAFMLASSASQAHVDGVGLCTVSSL